jgi:hypothetical protein
MVICCNFKLKTLFSMVIYCNFSCVHVFQLICCPQKSSVHPRHCWHWPLGMDDSLLPLPGLLMGLGRLDELTPKDMETQWKITCIAAIPRICHSYDKEERQKLLRTWMVVMHPTYMTTIPAVFGCEKESWDPFFPFPLWGWSKVTSSFGGQGCEPATTAVLQAVGSREEGAPKWWGAPTKLGMGERVQKASNVLECLLVISHYSGKYPMNFGCFKENCP